MCRVKCETVMEGVIDSEKVGRIRTAEGRIEEVSAHASLFGPENTLAVSRIGSRDSSVLIELPRESASGLWRVWVKEDQLEDSPVGV